MYNIVTETLTHFTLCNVYEYCIFELRYFYLYAIYN